MKHAIREVVKLSCVLNVVKVASDIQCEARDSATAQATPDMPESTLKRKREAVSPDNVRMLCSRIDTMRLSPSMTLTHDTEVVSKVCRSLASFSFRKESLEDGRSLSQDVVQGDRSLSQVLGQGGRSLSQGEIQDVEIGSCMQMWMQIFFQRSARRFYQIHLKEIHTGACQQKSSFLSSQAQNVSYI